MTRTRPWPWTPVLMGTPGLVGTPDLVGKPGLVGTLVPEHGTRVLNQREKKRPCTRGRCVLQHRLWSLPVGWLGLNWGCLVAGVGCRSRAGSRRPRGSCAFDAGRSSAWARSVWAGAGAAAGCGCCGIGRSAWGPTRGGCARRSWRASIAGIAGRAGVWAGCWVNGLPKHWRGGGPGTGSWWCRSRRRCGGGLRIRDWTTPVCWGGRWRTRSGRGCAAGSDARTAPGWRGHRCLLGPRRCVA